MKLNVIRLFNRQHEICVHMHWSMQQQVIVQGWYSGTITSWLYFRFQLMQLPKAIPACLPGGYPDIATLVVGHYVKSDGNGANGRTTREGSTMPPPPDFLFYWPIWPRSANWKRYLIGKSFQNANPGLVQWGKTTARNTKWTHLRKEHDVKENGGQQRTLKGEARWVILCNQGCTD